MGGYKVSGQGPDNSIPWSPALSPGAIEALLFLTGIPPFFTASLRRTVLTALFYMHFPLNFISQFSIKLHTFYYGCLVHRCFSILVRSQILQAAGLRLNPSTATVSCVTQASYEPLLSLSLLISKMQIKVILTS